MLNAVNLTFVAFSSKNHQISGQIFVFFVLVVAAAEAAVGLALVIALLALPLVEALYAAAVATVCATSMAWLAQRQIGGQTGDVLGSAEQLAETAILVLLATRLA